MAPRWSVVAFVVGVAAFWGTAARADRVEDLARQLRGDPDYKVRLSAALNLGKLADRRAVPALVDGLADRDKTVRGVAAAALGKLVDASVAEDVAARAIAGLERTARGDGDGMVRGEAARSLEAVRAARRAVAPRPPPPVAQGVYVEIGPMADATRKAPAVPPVMHKAVTQTLSRRGGFLLSWPGGASPTKVELARSGTRAFYVEGSLTALSVTRAPPHVACTISLVLATYPEKSMFGFMKGGAEVDAPSGSEAALAEATSDCVGAVLEDLVLSKLVPTIQARVN
jgi:hypothetical protein